jgi:hypothetical protein
MQLELVSHVNGDGDLLDAWFRYYRGLGISLFRLIVHGPEEDNRILYALKDKYPVVIEDSYGGPFHTEEKARRLNHLLTRLRGRWLMLVDSDEFVEFPYATIERTIRVLRLIGRNALSAPMVQRLTSGGTLETPALVEDPFRTFPLCSVDLYQRMNVKAAIAKHPLFFCTDQTAIREGGNHNCPYGNTTSSLRGVTHHFKFRRAVHNRLDNRINSAHPWRHESVQFREYLENNGNRLPRDGAFPYSRRELFRRGLLERFTFTTVFRHLSRVIADAKVPAVFERTHGAPEKKREH